MAIPAHLYAEMKAKHAQKKRERKRAAALKRRAAAKGRKLRTQLVAARREWHKYEACVGRAVRKVRALEQKLATLGR